LGQAVGKNPATPTRTVDTPGARGVCSAMFPRASSRGLRPRCDSAARLGGHLGSSEIVCGIERTDAFHRRNLPLGTIGHIEKVYATETSIREQMLTPAALTASAAGFDSVVEVVKSEIRGSRRLRNPG